MANNVAVLDKVHVVTSFYSADILNTMIIFGDYWAWKFEKSVF